MVQKPIPTASAWTLCAALITVVLFGSESAGRLTSEAFPQTREMVARQVRVEPRRVPECSISPHGIGPVRLGQTIGDARRAIPWAKFGRTSDGDGAALVEVTFGPETSVIVWADEDDPSAPIDWSKSITAIETFSLTCHTVDGIHPGMLVADVEKVFGPVERIVESEIESREYVSFERQPASLTLRLDYTGKFPGGSRETKRYSASARIYSIIVSPSRTP